MIKPKPWLSIPYRAVKPLITSLPSTRHYMMAVYVRIAVSHSQCEPHTRPVGIGMNYQ
jgi:hypothetical protein